MGGFLYIIVIPANAGIHRRYAIVDPCLRGDDIKSILCNSQFTNSQFFLLTHWRV